MLESEIASLIRRRRAQMLAHSYLYYVLDTPVVPDATWQEWADELVDLQAEHTHPVGYYDKEFADWTGETGMHLPRDALVRALAQMVLAPHESAVERGFLC